MRFALVFLLACSSSSSSTPKEPAPAAPAPAQGEAPKVMTEDECTAQGGRVNPSIGGGEQAHCEAGETELGPVRLGIEGGWCCKKP